VNGDAFLIPDWPAPARVRALATTRGDVGIGASSPPFDHFNLGAHCGDAADAVAHNRAALRELAALPGEPHWLRQVHGSTVVHETRAHPGLALQAAEGGMPEADASVTSDRDTVLAILSADCLPVLFSSADGDEVGAAHAGWRGLAAGVLENTIAAMQTPAPALIAWLGPAAGPLAYEIGEEVYAAFVERDLRAAAAFVPTRNGHWRVDLYALARLRLADAGVTRVHGGGLCTISDPQRFFSHRRDGRSGRMATLIWIDAE
jgi:polyphenol oxidase